MRLPGRIPQGWAARGMINLASSSGDGSAVDALIAAGAGEALVSALRHAADTGLGAIRTASERSADALSPDASSLACAQSTFRGPNSHPGETAHEGEQREQREALRALLGQTGAEWGSSPAPAAGDAGPGYKRAAGRRENETAQLLESAAAAARLAEDELASENGDEEVSEIGDFLLQTTGGREDDGEGGGAGTFSASRDGSPVCSALAEEKHVTGMFSSIVFISFRHSLEK